jgi:hypothetical protein
MRVALSVAVELRAVMPTSSTAAEAASAIATIFKWVARSAPTIVELLITAIFRGALQSKRCSSCSVVTGHLGSNALNARSLTRSLFLDCSVSVFQRGVTASQLAAKHAPRLGARRAALPPPNGGGKAGTKARTLRNMACCKTSLGDGRAWYSLCNRAKIDFKRADQGSVMPQGLQLTTTGLFNASQNGFATAASQCAEGDLNNGTANIALALRNLDKALFAELTQMSQDIAALKAEVAVLKAKSTGLQSGSHAYIGR